MLTLQGDTEPSHHVLDRKLLQEPSQQGLCSDLSRNWEPAKLGTLSEQVLGQGEKGDTCLDS